MEAQEMKDSSPLPMERNENEGSQDSGAKSKLVQMFSTGLQMAKNTVAQGPQATLELEKPRSQNIYQDGDRLAGVLSINIPFELQHEGIKVSITGKVVNNSNEVYYGAT